MAKFLECDGVELRPLEPDDLNTLYMWESEADAWKTNSVSAPYSRHLLLEYLRHYDADIYKNREVRMMLLYQGDAVGSVDVFNFDPVNSRAEIGLYLAAEHRGQHIGSRAIALVAEKYAFGVLGVHQVYCTVGADNDAALAAFADAGFERKALLSQWLRRGKGEFADAVIMQRLAR